MDHSLVDHSPARPRKSHRTISHRVAVFGLGYVGSVCAGCLANAGHRVIGVDTQRFKVDLINAGKSPVVENGLGELVEMAYGNGTLRATTDAAEAVHGSEVSIVCVATPSQANGSLDVAHVRHVCEQIGDAMKTRENGHIVVIRSTVLPGTMREVVVPSLEAASGKRVGHDFAVLNNPEFLREGTAVSDFCAPPKIVVGGDDSHAIDVLLDLYEDFEAPLVVTSTEVAEMVKYADNAWHADKVAFANEIGNICKTLKIDSHAVMDIFCQDTKLNLSSYYLKPGYAFGGSCLPKDLRALLYLARTQDVSAPLLESILVSNHNQVERALDVIIHQNSRNIGILGFSFKAGTDDLRESPLVELIERLHGKGYNLKLFDRNVNLTRLVGANRNYIEKMVPHICGLMTESIDELLQFSDLIVVGTNDPTFASLAQRLRPHQRVIDMVRIPELQIAGEAYDGINW